jgi:hypothetical protein
MQNSRLAGNRRYHTWIISTCAGSGRFENLSHNRAGVVDESIGDAEISFGGRGRIVNISSGGVLLETVKRGEQR